MAKKRTPQESLEKLLKLKVPELTQYPFLMEMNLPDEITKDLTLDDVFWLQLVHKSLYGDSKAMQEVLDRRFGKAQQHIVQENHNFTYLDFLDKIAEEERQLLTDSEPVVVIDAEHSDLPQVEETTSPETGVSSGDDVLRDLGLL